MKIFDNMIQRAAGAMIEKRATELSVEQVSRLIDGGGTSSSFVTPKSALHVSTVLACARVIAEGCATPNVRLYRELKVDGKIKREKADNIPEARLLERRPNEWQTSFEWRRMMTLHACLSGAGLSIIVRGDNGRVRELIPVQPGSWQLQRNGRYNFTYRCWDEWGEIGNFGPDDVFVLRNLQWDLVQQLVPTELARAAIDLAMNNDKMLASQQQNGQRPSGTYSVPGKLNEEQHGRLEKWITARTSGKNAGKPLVLDNGATWTSTTAGNRESQTSELRAQTVEDICRAFNVFPIMVGHSDKTATFASSEAFFSAHLKHTLAPWHKNWTSLFDEKLLDGTGPLYVEFDTRYLTAGSMKDQAEYARSMTEMGNLTRNEIRDDLGRDPLDGLDDPLTPLNLTTNPDGATPNETTPPPAA